ELSFKDNGKGIDLQKNSHMLFGLYKRFDTTVEGKGMGLFMVKTQVEALGGTIKVKSKPGQGSNFIATLPL
ncbi:MAG TPA: HAMP domain-containing sensor histidine kinase, partial [Mucilaginibacter sp.]